MAATANGPLVRRDKRPFSAADFWPDDAWAPPPEAAPPAPGTKPRPLAPDFSHVRGLKQAKVKKPAKE